MKKLEDFSTEIVDLRSFNGTGEFVHTGGKFFSSYINDTFYDDNGNGELDDDEAASFCLVVANPSN
jgi:hypothetical protein